MLVAPTVERIETRVASLAGRVETALQLSEMIRKNALPQHTPAAFVLPTGLRGGPEDAGAGAFTQMLSEMVGVVLVVRDNTPTGRLALREFDTLVRSVVEAVAGWAPSDQVGVFRVVSGRVISAASGAVVYQLEFSISDQLRIQP
ncbi:phage tail terminator protein [Oceaniglobus trochenteri]|uniref:phage tail terminator protein n=1 Tax=Oceaniglobus trochenteri TaxID=2763260 RepID=UPI001CFFE369|nr:hypothetical protein [Oceaniglobus trochenteri]